MNFDFDLTGRQTWILRSWRSLTDDSGCPQHIFVADIAGDGMSLRCNFRIERDLGDSVAITQVDEDQPAEIPTPVHPTEERHLTAFVRDLRSCRRLVFLSPKDRRRT